MSTVAVAENRRRWTGDIRYTSLREALDFLEIRGPVEIKRANGIRRRGAHRYRNNGHIITVSTYSTVAEANRTILHELAHAAQVERYSDPKLFATAYTAESARRGYRANAFEVEARAAADFSDDFRITR